MTTRIYIDRSVVATNYLDIIPYPFDITLLPSLIPGLILQMDFDVNDPASLTRNRVGAPATVVGSPTLGVNGVTLSKTAYINTGLDIAALNASDITQIAIVNAPAAQVAIMGRMQLNSPQRSRGIYATTASWRSTWLTASSSAQNASATIATPAGYSEFIAGRFIRDNGSGSMLTKIKLCRTGSEITQTAAAAPYSMPSSNILLGAPVDDSTSGTLFARAFLIANRALTDAELGTIYLYYKNYFLLKSISI